MGVQGLGTINIYKGEFTLTFACPKIYSNVEAPTMNMSSTYCLVRNLNPVQHFESLSLIPLRASTEPFW
jgi:hypothetical protein